MTAGTDDCPHCRGTGWVCEAHPTESRDHDPDCAGPAMLCACPIGQELERQLDAIRAEGRLAKLGDTTP